MSEQILEPRRRALEESFFAKHNRKLLQALRGEAARLARRDALAVASGIGDEVVLDHLLDAGLEAESVAALALVPLLAVAWADGELDTRERRAILEAASSTGGTERRGPAYALLEQWLAQAPDHTLIALWAEYAGGLARSLAPDARRAVRADMLSRARAVAEVSGGLLGLGKRISPAERLALQRLRAALSD